MSPVFDCSTGDGREAGLAAAKEAIAEGRLVVLPTDTVYGVGADAFNATGVEAIFTAKGRGREMPPPVLVPNARTVDGLGMAVPSYARRLMEAFWPGGLTLVVRAQLSLSWDLGDTNGTVGLRMPDDELALSLLAETGPLAVSSANRTGQPAATTVTEAGFQLGHYVDVYLDGGPRAEQAPSTILDCTKPDPVVLRVGAIGLDRLREVLGSVELVVPVGVDPDDADDGDDGWSGGAPELTERDDEPDEAADELAEGEPDQDGPPDDARLHSSADADEGDEQSLGQHWEDTASACAPAPPSAAASIYVPGTDSSTSVNDDSAPTDPTDR